MISFSNSGGFWGVNYDIQEVEDQALCLALRQGETMTEFKLVRREKNPFCLNSPCLSKQRVREAIENTFTEKVMRTHWFKIWKKSFEKELGL